MILITKHETENVLNDDGLVVYVFDKVLNNGLNLVISYKGKQLALMFGDKMREVLTKLHEHNIEVELA